MKPRNAREREVVRLSGKLRNVSAKQIDWAKEHVFEHEAYKCKDEMWCSECGGFWINTNISELSAAILGKEVECPHCHHKLKVRVSRRQKTDDVQYMTIVTVCGAYQVLRHICCKRFTYKSSEYRIGDNIDYSFSEVVQEWINASGKRTIIAQSMNMSRSGWLHNSDRSIKPEYGCSSYYYNQYAIQGEIYPHIQIISELKKRGLNKRFLNLDSPSVMMQRLLEGGNDLELCIKTRQYDMLRYIGGNGYYRLEYKPSFNICNRNHYIIKDASMWVDYIRLLEYFHKDIHNAHYVCPKNLSEEHDILLFKKQKIERELVRQKAHEAAIKAAIQRKVSILKFYKDKSRFFGLIIQGDGITIRPLESVTQFYLEGTAMHHCVFGMGYYKKSNSLILSARDKDGKRLETIEVNLKTFQIVQSRAVCNGVTDRHNDIINLLKKNINLIKRVA